MIEALTIVCLSTDDLVLKVQGGHVHSLCMEPGLGQASMALRVALP